MRRLITWAALATLAAACSSIDCPVENTVNTVCGFYRADGTADTLKTDTLTVSTTRRDGNDTVVINRDVNATGCKLPVSSGAAADTFHIALRDTAGGVSTATMMIDKTDRPQFESVDCKMAFFHTITQVRWTGSAIDSVVIKKQNVDYDASSQHLYIYFKARR